MERRCRESDDRRPAPSQLASEEEKKKNHRRHTFLLFGITKTKKKFFEKSIRVRRKKRGLRIEGGK